MELSRRGIIRLAGAAGLAAATGTALSVVPARPAQANQDFWRWCRLCQGLWYGFNGTGGACPARGAAGHSYAGSGNYSLPQAFQDFFPWNFGQDRWVWCNRCQGLWYADSNTLGACPAGPGGHDDTGTTNNSYGPHVNDGSGQPNWRWCHQCQGMWFAANGTGGVCPAPGAAGHSMVGSGNYHLDVDN